MPAHRSFPLIAAILVLFSPISLDLLAQEETPPPQLQFLEGPKSAVLAVGYGAAGQTIVGASAEGNLYFWDAASGQLIGQVAGHDAPILSLAVSPDGYQLASGGRDRLIKIFDLPSIHPLSSFAGFAAPPTGVAVAADGTLVLTGDGANQVRLWNAANNQNVRNFAATAPVTDVAMLLEQRTALSGTADGSLHAWNLDDGAVIAHVLTTPISAIAPSAAGDRVAAAGTDGVLRLLTWPPQPVRSLATHANPVTAVKVSGDGKLIVSGSLDQTVRLFNGETGEAVNSLAGQPGPVTALALSKDSAQVASASQTGIIKFWQTADGADGGTLAGHDGAIHALAFHPTQPQIASAGADGTVRVWQTPTDEPPLAGHTMPVNSIALGAEAKTAVTAGADASLRLWNLADRKQVWAVEGLPQPLQHVAVAPGSEQFASSDAAGTLRLHAAADGAVQNTRGAHAGPITGLQYRPEGKQLVTSGLDGLVKFWNLPLVAPRMLPDHPEGASSVAFVDAATLVSATPDGAIRVIESSSGKELRKLEGLGGPATTLSVSSDGKLIAAGTADGAVRFWLAEDGSDAGAVAGRTGAVQAVAFNPKQPQAATAGADGTIRVWSLPEPPQEVATHAGPVRAVASSADGKQVVTGGDDGIAFLWTHGAQQPAQKLADHQSAIHAAAFRADGKQIATGDETGIVRLTSADGQLQIVLGAHEGSVTAAAYHPTDGTLATAGADGSVKIWQIPAAPSTELGKHTAAATGLALTSDSKIAVTVGADKTLRIFDLAQAEQTRWIDLPAAATAVAISPNNALVAACVDKATVNVFQLTDGAAQSNVKHPGVAGVAFAADNAHFATYGADGVIRIWQLPLADDSVPTQEIIVGNGKIALTSAAYTPGGAYIVVGDADRNVTLFSVSGGNAVRGFAGNTAAIHAVAVSADGTKIASAGADKTARVWNLANGNIEATLEHPAPVTCVTFRADATRVVTGCEDGVLRVWDLASGKIVQRIFDHTKPVAGVALAADNTTIISAGSDGTIRRSTVLDKVFIPAAHEGGVRGLAFTPNGQQLVTCGADKLVKVFDLTGAMVRQMTDCPMPLRCLAVRGDSLQVTAAGEDNQLYQWRLDTGALERKIAAPAAVASLAYNADGTRLVAAAADGHLRSYNPADGLLLEDVATPAEINCVTFAVDNSTVAFGGADKRASLQQLPFVRLLAGHDGAVTALAFTPDGTGLISGGADKTVRHWNIDTGAAIRSMAHTGTVTGVGVTGDGTQIISASADKTVRTWTLATGAQAAAITLDTPVRKLALSGDTTRAATAGDDNIVRTWDVASGRELERFAGHEAAIASLAFSPDNRTVVSASADKSVRAWTVGVECLIVADATSVHAMSLTPDGKQVVTAGEDKLVKLWDLDGKMVRQFAGAVAPPRSLAVRGDGAQIAAGGDPVLTQANVYVWNAADGKLARTLATPAPVSSITYSGNGKLAVASADKHLRVYAADDARLLQDWTAAAMLNDLAFAPDSTTLVSAAADNNAYVFQYSLLQLLAGHEGAVTGVAFTPTGSQLLTCGADKTVRMWNAADGKPLCQFMGSTAAVQSLALSADGKRLAAAGEDKIVRVWDVPADDAQPTAQIQPAATFTHDAIVRSVSISADGNVVAAAGDDNLVRLWDVATGKERERLAGPTAAVLAVSISADGHTLASGAADNVARQFFPAVLSAVAAHEGEIHDVAFSADGKEVFTTGADKLVKRISIGLDDAPDAGANDANSDAPFAGPTASIRAIAASRDGKYVAAGGNDMTLYVWTAADGKSVATIKTPAAITSLATSSDGRTIVAAGADNAIRNYALLEADGQWQLNLMHESLGHEGAVTSVSLADDDRTLWSVAADSTAKRWLVASAFPRQTFSGHNGPIYDLSYRADGRLLASASGDKTIRAWDTTDGAVRFTCNGHQHQVTGVSFRPDGAQLASCSLDRTVRIWSAELPPDSPPAAADADAAPPVDAAPPEEKPQPGEQLMVITDDITGGLNSVAFAPNGAYLVAGGSAKTWWQWQVGGETPFALLRSGSIHNHAIYRIVPNPASSRFATIDFSGNLFVWDASNGNPLFHQQLPTSTGYGIAYAPNGQELVAATADHRIMRIIIPPPAR